MAPLPGRFSVVAQPIASAISEGRAEEAMQKLTSLLESGSADAAVQQLAAKWILTVGLKDGDAKKLRGGHDSLLKEWVDVAEMVAELQDGGATYANAVTSAAGYFGYSERHVQKCIAQWRKAKVSD